MGGTGRGGAYGRHPALGPSCDAHGAGPGSALADEAEAENASGPCYDARTGGGGWQLAETRDLEVRRQPRRLLCVRRSARGQRWRTEESEPEAARSRSVRSQDVEHPGAQLQHVSTVPSPRAACLSSLSPRFCTLCACGQVALPSRTPSLCLWFPPRACRATPTQGRAPEAHTQNSMVCDPLGGRGNPRHRRNWGASL